MWRGASATAALAFLFLRGAGMKAFGQEGSSSGEVKDNALKFALVKHPSDPGDPAGKLVLGVRSAAASSKNPKSKRAARESGPEDASSGGGTPSPAIGDLVAGVFPGGIHQTEESEVRAFVPRQFKPPVCVPARVAKCFCTVDILDE